MSLLAMAACDNTVPTGSMQDPSPRAAKLDGANGGNPHFYFLPPVAPNPTYTGVFNPNLVPTLEICGTTEQDADGHCVTLVAKFYTYVQNGQTTLITVETDKYQLNWKADLYPIAEEVAFRVVVHLGDEMLGFFDMKKSQGTYRDADTNAVISANSNVPIKFRIEEGALCGDAPECFEGSVGPNGGTFTIDGPNGTKPAGTEFPAGALDQNVNLIITSIESGECLPTDVPQYRGCYRFETEPHVENFTLPATVGICLTEAAGVPFYNDGQLQLWKWSETNGDQLQELEKVIIDYLVCPDPNTLSARGGNSLLLGAARAGSWLLKPLAAVFGPSEAYAMIGYEGGKLGNFSRIGWVRPLKVEIKAGNNQTGLVGQPLPIDPQVRVTNKYGNTVQGVPFRTIDWTPSVNGSASPSTNITDMLGQAATSWTLSTTPGINTLHARTPTSRAIAPVPYEAEATFTATGVTAPSGVLWLPLIGNPWDGISGIVSSQFVPQLVITAPGKPTITATPTMTSTSYRVVRTYTEFSHSTTYRAAVKLAGVTLGYVDFNRGTASKQLIDIATGRVIADVTVSKDVVFSFRLVL